jgi:hypothetical protein
MCGRLAKEITVDPYSWLKNIYRGLFDSIGSSGDVFWLYGYSSKGWGKKIFERIFNGSNKCRRLNQNDFSDNLYCVEFYP